MRINKLSRAGQLGELNFGNWPITVAILAIGLLIECRAMEARSLRLALRWSAAGAPATVQA